MTEYQSHTWEDENGGRFIILYPGAEKADEEGEARLRAMGARELAALREREAAERDGAEPGPGGWRRSVTVSLGDATPLPGPRLDPEWLRAWCAETEAALPGFTRSFAERYGFPPGENALAPATEHSLRAADALAELLPLPADLATLHRALAGASLPDVDNGYFIHAPETVTAQLRDYGVPAVEGERLPLVFGSDGGGHLFATGHTGRVWRSATASVDGGFELVAGTLEDFLREIGGLIADR
ncbi:hypothetical protein ACFWIQ_21355 [Kitasatospora sp. NPDC127059]|uniref:hypothetical protein n=1 Tax=unclassified Kitasatospora TaxID=2633591 RepID=UPI00365DA551